MRGVRYYENGDPKNDIDSPQPLPCRQAIARRLDQKGLARKPQTFDTSDLPLFGDSHKQKELF